MMAENVQEIKVGDVVVSRRIEGFRQTEQIARLIEALIKAQGQIQNAERNQENPHFHYRYADLAAVWDSVRGPLTSNGLCLIQGATTSFSDAGAVVTVTTRLMHHSGEWIENEVAADARTGGPQEVGSTITYLKRYALSAMLGCAAEDDDDGEGAEGRGRAEQRPQQKGNQGPQQKGNQKSSAKPTGAKLAEKDVKAVAVAFEKFKVTVPQLEEKLGKPSGQWTDDERQRAVAIYKELEEGTRKEDIFGQHIEDPKEAGAKA